jgi:hypothetical protein
MRAQQVSSIGPQTQARARGAGAQARGTLVRLELKGPDDADTKAEELAEALVRQAARCSISSRMQGKAARAAFLVRCQLPAAVLACPFPFQVASLGVPRLVERRPAGVASAWHGMAQRRAAAPSSSTALDTALLRISRFAARGASSRPAPCRSISQMFHGDADHGDAW